MKIKKTVFYVLMFLPLAAVLIALQFLPEQIPAHYNFSGQVDRWGSKYEALTFPAAAITIGCIMLGIAKYLAKHEESGKNNESICIITGIATLVIFNAMTGFFLYMDFNGVENISSAEIDFNQIAFGILGISMMILGNVLPKLRRNSFIGLRTSWSMKNDDTWKRSQRFGGVSLIIGGAVMTVISLLTQGTVCTICAMGVIVCILAVDVCYTYKIAKKY